MSSLSMVEANLPPGFRFHPRDDELVLHYLSNKLGGGGAATIGGWPALVDVDLNKCEPWDLPEIACIGGKEWYFYNLKDRKYGTGQRTNRATESGYWKATGKDREIRCKGLLVGMRKTLVFHRGRAPKGTRTDWVMHEFRKELQQGGHPHKELDWVLCRVFYKSRATVAIPRMETTTSSSCVNVDATSTITPLPPLIGNSISSFNDVLPGVPERNAEEGYNNELVPSFSSSARPSLSSTTTTMMNAAPDAGGDHQCLLSEGHRAGKATAGDVVNNHSQLSRFDQGLSMVKTEGLLMVDDVQRLVDQEGFESFYYCLI